MAVTSLASQARTAVIGLSSKPPAALDAAFSTHGQSPHPMHCSHTPSPLAHRVQGTSSLSTP
ncbi:hypothetical protein TRAPUB_573, partial [Trametes pubescens]